MITEIAIRKKPHALFGIFQRGPKERVLRCLICYLGFSGERVVKRACKHVRNAHTIETRAKIRNPNRTGRMSA